MIILLLLMVWAGLKHHLWFLPFQFSAIPPSNLGVSTHPPRSCKSMAGPCCNKTCCLKKGLGTSLFQTILPFWEENNQDPSTIQKRDVETPYICIVWSPAKLGNWTPLGPQKPIKNGRSPTPSNQLLWLSFCQITKRQPPQHQSDLLPQRAWAPSGHQHPGANGSFRQNGTRRFLGWCFWRDFRTNTTIWWFQPTHLKNMLVKLDHLEWNQKHHAQEVKVAYWMDS